MFSSASFLECSRVFLVSRVFSSVLGFLEFYLVLSSFLGFLECEFSRVFSSFHGFFRVSSSVLGFLAFS